MISFIPRVSASSSSLDFLLCAPFKYLDNFSSKIESIFLEVIVVSDLKAPSLSFVSNNMFFQIVSFLTIPFVPFLIATFQEKKTGVWFCEFATPYERFVEAGYDVTVASIQGGAVPIGMTSP